jgi:hypothetical protein
MIRALVVSGLVLVGSLPGQAEIPFCADPTLMPSEDYSFLVGSANPLSLQGDLSASGFQWLINGSPGPAGEVGELLHLPLDGFVSGSGGEHPLTAVVSFTEGRWGSALQPMGSYRFAREGNLALDQGTIEMWIAPIADGDDAIYLDRMHSLFYYQAASDSLIIFHDSDTGIIAAGGTVAGEWQSAWGHAASSRGWRAGEWHHLAVTYSEAGSFIRLYLDGVLVADTNEGDYREPSADGDSFYIGGSPWGSTASYLIDEVRLSSQVAGAAEIAARARRSDQPRPLEVWLPVSEISPGDSVAFELILADSTSCTSGPLVFPGIPVIDPEPPSTLLAPGATSVELAVSSIAPTSCAWAVGEPLPFDDMTPFDSGSGTSQHRTVVRGLDADANTVNQVYVRCATHPDYLLHLRYRSLSRTEPGYPRTGNLWGSWQYLERGLEHCARIDLWLGGVFSPDQIRQLRRLNPQVRVLTSINAIEHPGLPEDYYLHDVDGNRIEVWPGSYRLNLTKDYVAEHQARLAYQRIIDSDLMYDGCFFDNVMTSQSWWDTDIYGNPFPVDADEDGEVDDPAEFDAAWKTGVFHELTLFRELMPDAVVSGHAMDIFEPGIAGIFNGIGIGFYTADVIEGKMSFLDLWRMAVAWNDLALSPTATMVESSPPDQIAYGYGYRPWRDIPQPTIEFARTYYPYVRFGLAFTLMTDAYFAHEIGDTWHGNDWWYDELDFVLGDPLGPAEFLWLDSEPGGNQIVNPGFEEPIAAPWAMWVDTGAGCAATMSRDTNQAAEGTASVWIDVEATCDEVWKIDLAQWDRSLSAGVSYDLSFWARADESRSIALSAQKGSPDWRSFGLYQHQPITTEWREYTVSFTATEDTDDARILFFLGAATGSVWLDHVRLGERPPNVLRRDFGRGVVLLNATDEPREIELGPGFRRLTGSQAPRHQVIIDDRGPAFSTLGEWTEVTLDSGEWQALGPYFHEWGEACHESRGPAGEACWDLPITERDTYTIETWWPAAPEAGSWTTIAGFEVRAGDQVLASTTLDQSTGGDQWHRIAEVELAPADNARVCLVCASGDTCIADALHLFSAARYNDGAEVSTVTLQPMDGIILERLSPLRRPGGRRP